MFAAGFAVAGLIVAAGTGVVAQQELHDAPQTNAGATRSLANIRTTRGPYPVVVIDLPSTASETGRPQVLATLSLPGAERVETRVRADHVTALPRPEPERLFQPRPSQTINLGGLPSIAPAEDGMDTTEAESGTAYQAASDGSAPALEDPGLASPGDGIEAGRQDVRRGTATSAASGLSQTAVSVAAASTGEGPVPGGSRDSESASRTDTDPSTPSPPVQEASARPAAPASSDQPSRKKQAPAGRTTNRAVSAPTTARPRDTSGSRTYQDGMKVVEVASLSRPEPEHRPPPDEEMIVPSRSGPELYVVEQKGKFSGVWLHTPRTRDNWREPDVCRYFINQSRRLGRYLDRLPQDCGADQVRRISVVQAARLGRNPDGTVRPR